MNFVYKQLRDTEVDKMFSVEISLDKHTSRKINVIAVSLMFLYYKCEQLLQERLMSSDVKRLLQMKVENDEWPRTISIEPFRIVAGENSINVRDSFVLTVCHRWSHSFSSLKSTRRRIYPTSQEEYLEWIVAIDSPMWLMTDHCDNRSMLLFAARYGGCRRVEDSSLNARSFEMNAR